MLCSEFSPKQMSPLALAFVGDGVYELLVREHVAAKGSLSPHMLHLQAVNYVRASAQSAAVEEIAPLFSLEEEQIYKRGRNANSGTVPKSVDPVQYRRATGLEALFGFLYLEGRIDRIQVLFSVICQGVDKRLAENTN